MLKCGIRSGGSLGLPVREGHPLCPLHPYGVSKVAQDLLAAQYFANYAIPSVRIRIFNTTGPGKIGDVCSDLTRRAVEIELGMRPPSLMVGNLTKRAIIDVRISCGAFGYQQNAVWPATSTTWAQTRFTQFKK